MTFKDLANIEERIGADISVHSIEANPEDAF